MKRDLEKKLQKEFPNLYIDLYGSVDQTCMAWGFECGDGWFDLIYDLSKKLEKLILEIPEEARNKYGASQVKEKFGELRFYLKAGTDEMFELCDEAEDKSGTICEKCGAPGKIRNQRGWLSCLCEDCFSKKEK